MNGVKPKRSGRNQYGDKLTPDKIEEIRTLLLTTKLTQAEIAAHIGCSQGMISHVKHGRRGV
jgi:antitoxin component HigA of HigAB toxin-antitoxin module